MLARVDTSHSSMTRTLSLVYFNAGGGHRAAALALEAVIKQQRRPWRTQLVNLFDVLDPKALFRKFTGMAPEDIYNMRLAKGWTLGLAQELKVLQAMIRFGHASLVRQLQDHWLSTEPDLVVSLVPNFNRPLYDSVAQALPGVPFVTVMTDMADHPPNFWIEPDQDQYLVCGTEHALAQARSMGLRDDRLFLTSGMIIRPDFYEPSNIDRRSTREGLGLDPARPTGVVMFGGEGSMAMRSISAQLHDIPLILLCGRNAPLAQALREQSCAAPRVIVGFTPEVSRYMRVGDFFIGKPGPASLSEAIHHGLPVVTVRNSWTMPQERYNASWICERDVGVVHRSNRTIRAAVQRAMERLPELQANARRVDNRAVFEIPQILEEILVRSATPSMNIRGPAFCPSIEQVALNL